MRIGGLASGIDTESIIKDLMKAERIPLDKVTQKKSYFEWQLNDYRTANRDLKDFSTKLFDNAILSKNYNQKNVTVSDPSAVDIRSKGNSEDFSGTITVKQLATNATFNGGKESNKSKEVKEVSSISIKAPGDDNAVEIEFNVGDTMKDIVKKINENSSVRAFYDEETGKVGFTAKQSGEGDITISNGSKGGALASDLGIAGTTIDNTGEGITGGKNSIITYNGMDIERSSNKFDLDGLEITLKEATNKKVTFSATTDTEKVFDNIKGFVDDYNKLIEDLNKKIREPKYRDFQPLSAEQKKDMSDKEVELWEEKAMSGTLRNDPELTKMLSSMRNVLTGSVNIGPGDEKISLSEIGITTSSNYLDHGKLIIDDKKLKEAISQRPQDVEKLFANNGTGKEEGLARRLRTEVDATQKSIQKSAGKVGDTTKSFTLGRTLDNMNKQIERFETRMQMAESRYWKQFNAMENAIQRANAQSASLMSSLGGGM